MDKKTDRKEEIFNLLLDASEKSFSRLFEEHNEQFYYCSLVMMDCAVPCITALSEEAYHELLVEYADGDDSSEEDRSYYRWAYAESPYLGFGYEEYFNEVSDCFLKDVSHALSDTEFTEHVNDWLEAMVKVMKTLKEKGLFAGREILLLAEQQPSDTDCNVDNARYLNDEALFNAWCKDNIE